MLQNISMIGLKGRPTTASVLLLCKNVTIKTEKNKMFKLQLLCVGLCTLTRPL